jgi:hypothetical protein
MDAQHADDWREVTAKLQQAASAGDTADAVQALEVVLDEGNVFESDVVKDAAMVTAALQQAADAELFVDRQGDVVTQLICSRCAHGLLRSGQQRASQCGASGPLRVRCAVPLPQASQW